MINDLESVLDSILRKVKKPGRYIGNEIYAVKKNHQDVDVTFSLFFPDVYELGMSYLGFQILYNILNQQDFIAAERVFSPWPDFEQVLRENRIPLFALESKKPVCSFDIVGFTLQYELHATNILNGLDLSGIPIYSEERSENDPLIIAGGPNATNPEPFADFFDAIVIGDGEVVVVEIADIVRKKKKNGWSRRKTLDELAKLEGLYIPRFFKPDYDKKGKFLNILPENSSAKLPVKGRVEKLRESYYPRRPLIPLIRTTHNRLSVEVMRGCTRGCRFCHAGYYYRPGRERSAKEVAEYIQETVLNCGNDEFSLLSLSTSDYTQLALLWWELRDFLSEHHVSLALPSLRPETVTAELLQLLQTEKKSGITIAPEAGSLRLRNVINKTLKDEDIFRAVDLAFEYGWKSVKLYFMIGLPTETDEDLLGIVDLINQIGVKASSFNAKVKVSLSPFNPKAQTPFQWVAQEDIKTIERKIALIRDKISGRSIKLNWRNPEVTKLEGILARGDRRLSKVIYQAWQLGGRFEAWTNYFDWNRWQQAFDLAEIDPESYSSSREVEKNLPWQHLSRGVTTAYFQKEWESALEQQTIEDCKFGLCNHCGLMADPVCKDILKRDKKGGLKKAVPGFNWPDITKNPPSRPDAVKTAVYCRIRYSKTGLMKHIGHLDLITLLQRILRITKLPVVYTRGFSQRPRLSFAPPLPLGMESYCEYLDFQLFEPVEFDLKDKFNQFLPGGLEVMEVLMGPEKLTSFQNFIEVAVYQIKFCDPIDLKPLIRKFKLTKELWFEKRSKKGKKLVDLKAFVKSINFRKADRKLTIKLNVMSGKTVKIREVLFHGLGLSEDIIDSSGKTRLYVGPGEDKAVDDGRWTMDDGTGGRAAGGGD